MKLLKEFSSKKNLLYLAMLAVVFTASFAIAVTKRGEIQKLVYQEGKASDLPLLKESSGFPIVSAQGALAVDLDSGVTLYEKNADQKLLPASTTKIMTALVAMDYYKLDQVITIGQISVGTDTQRMGLVPGEQITFQDLLYGLLVYSASDVAMTLADNYSGGVEAFVAAMNQKAQALSLVNTQFENPVGLDGNGDQVSTAKDMVRLTRVAMQNPEFAKIVATKTVTIKSVDGKYVYPLTNINILLGKVDGVFGVKTGWTENARENLITYINRNNRKVMIAVLGSQDRFGETKELIDWIYGSYEWKKVGLKL